MTYTPLLTERAVVLFGIETTSGVAQSLDPTVNAVLVESPDYTADPQKIERKFSKADMSNFAFDIGRITGQASFTVEVRGNGTQQAGSLSDTPMLATLMQACGFALTAIAAGTSQIGTVYAELGNVGAATWTNTTAPTLTAPVAYTLVCTTAGLAAAAHVTITPSDPTIAPVTGVALAAAVVLPGNGGSITCTTQEALAVGDTFHVLVTPPGIQAVPISTGFQTATIEMYFDGLLHTLYGAMGTFKITADAGMIGKVEFTFQGIHSAVVDSAMPTDAVYDNLTPPLFEDACLTWDDPASSLVMQALTFDLAGKHAVREDANSANGYRGWQYTGRDPAGGLTPEATLEGNHPFWANFTSGKQTYLSARFGTTPGNTMVMEGPRAQVGSQKYTDKNSNRVYDLTLAFARAQGNDEIRFVFC